MASTIKLKNGSGAPTSGQLVQGEPALDLTNKRLYTENASGTVIEVGTNPSSLTIGGTALTATAAELNTLDGITATTAELNTLDGITATVTELNYTDGVTSNIQTQLNTKAPIASPTFTGTVTAPAVNVNGTVTADGATVTGRITIQDATSPELRIVDGNNVNSDFLIYSPDGVNSLNIKAGSTQTDAFSIASGGDISFYEDTGTTAKFFWDASAESLGIGTTSPIAALDVTGTDSTGSLTSLGDTVTRAAAVIRGSTHANGYGLYMGYGNSTTDAQYIQATRASGSAAFPLLLNPYGGNVGIGTSSPDHSLEIEGTFGSQFKISRATAPDTQYMTIAAGGNAVVFDSYETTSHSTYIWKSSISGSSLERARLDSSGNLLIGTSTAGASKLVVNDDSIQVNTAKTPASASDTGTTGEIAWDANYVYVCVATNTWKRSALSTW